MTVLLSIKDLVIEYATQDGKVRALDGADLELLAGETLGIVGESGSGKSTLGAAIGRVLPEGAMRRVGDILLAGASVFGASDMAVREMRRRDLGFIFQNPMTSLDPTMRVGRQVSHVLGNSAGGGGIEALLRKVGLPDGAQVARSYPHQLSGGMAQRVAIAMAIARGPRLLIADEPIASLDTSVREQILDLLLSLREQTGASLIILSHDLHMIAKHCDRVAVMYGGRIVEDGGSKTVFGRPGHPYTRALMAAAPGSEDSGGALKPIAGMPPVLTGRSEACFFAPRCADAVETCRSVRPAARTLDDRLIVCDRAEDLLGAGRPSLPQSEAAT